MYIKIKSLNLQQIQTSMKIIRNFLLTMALSAFGLQMAHAVPAYPGVIRAHQSDGTVISIKNWGDEHYHQTFTADGYPLVFNASTGNYEYAVLNNGGLRSSGIKAADAANRSAEAVRFLSTVNVDEARQAYVAHARAARAKYNALMSNRAPLNISSSSIQKQRTTNIPTTGNRKVLVLLVEFSDVSFSTMDNAYQHYYNQFNQKGYTDVYGSVGSVRDFYEQSSNGLYTPEYVIAGPVKLSKASTYYGANVGYGGGDDSKRIAEMVTDACRAVNDTIDFSQFDTDNDGYCDNVYVIYAGYGAADSGQPSTIWPHSYNLSYTGNSIELDGVTIDHYACNQEINGSNGNYGGIGVFVHEFGHVLGFADHYNTENSYSQYTPGDWDTMCSGSYNHGGYVPPYYTAYERACLGWLDPTELSLSTDTVVNLGSLGETSKALFVTNPKSSSEFFVIENRQQTGFDKYLPGHGMLVWHIQYNSQYWGANIVNNDDDHQRVDIVEANGRVPAGAGAAFPGTSSVRTFDFPLRNNSILFSFADVQEKDQVVSFRLGGAKAGLGAPSGIAASNISGTQATITWNKVKDATGYQLKIVPDGGAASDTVLYSVNEPTLQLTGLNPQTTYRVYVATVYNEYVSSFNASTFNTTEPQFFEKSVTVLNPTNVTGNSFQANWEAMDGASSYLVSLYNPTFDGQSEQTTHFDGSTMPENWSSNSSAFVDDYYGEHAPSLRLNKAVQWLQINVPDTTAALGLNLWYYIPRSGATMVIQTSADGVSYKSAAQAKSDGQPHYAKFTFPETNYIRVLFSGTSYTTYLYLDDVSLVYRDWAYAEIGSAQSATGTSYVFNGLQPNTAYAFGVVGVNGDQQTQPSSKVRLTTLNDATAINSVEVGDNVPAIYFDLTGRKVDYATAPQGIYLMKRGEKTVKVMKR